MKRFLSIFIIVILTMSFVACGGESSTTHTTQQYPLKEGILSFLNTLQKTASVPAQLQTYVRDAQTFNLSVNKSRGNIYFQLSVSVPSENTALETSNSDINITTTGSTVMVEGFAPITFEDAAASVFTGDTSWILHLIYDKTVMFTVGTYLPHGATLFVLSTSENSPWDTYISLKSLGVADSDPTQEGDVYKLTLKDGNTVFLIGVEGGVDIYK